MSSSTDDRAARVAGRTPDASPEAVGAHDLRIGGFVPLSTVDWPGQLVATVFTRGCPWDCPYCHNPHLLSATVSESDHETGGDVPTWPEIVAFLDTRRSLLDGVVFTGGEPTLQADLPGAVSDVCARGFSAALHTGGPFPERLGALLPQLDWVGFDVKAPFARYERITGRPDSGLAALASLRLLVDSGVDFEVRTTVHPRLLSPADLTAMAAELRAEGVRRWFLQPFRPLGTREGLLDATPFDANSLPDDIGDGFEEFGVRG